MFIAYNDSDVATAGIMAIKRLTYAPGVRKVSFRTSKKVKLSNLVHKCI